MYPSSLLHHQPYHRFMFRVNCCIRNEKQQWCARDRVINFGKYKGKMLGSLPSKYLRWVSKTLRARDYEEWAILADQVLVDPIYRDRIEWEFALNVLDGNSRSTGPADSQLEEISERFGWDNLDKIGWSKVDFDLLGTSKGGRIPRLDENRASQPNLPPPATTATATNSRRMKRREKLKIKLRRMSQQQQQQHKDEDDTVADDDDDDDSYSENDDKNKDDNIANPFPGRQALLRKAINHRGTFLN